MNNRRVRFEKKEEPCIISVETLIERIRKARALNCNPTYLGLDSASCKKAFFNKLGLFTRL